jgi:hypothetical protein
MHVPRTVHTAKPQSSDIALILSSCAEGVSAAGKQKEFIDSYLAGDSYCLTHQHPHLESLGCTPGMCHHNHELHDGLTTMQFDSDVPTTKAQDLLQRTTGLQLEKG